MDASPHNQAAVSWALHEAETTARPLNLVSVLVDETVPRPSHPAPIDGDREQVVVRRFAAEISRSRPELRVSYELEREGIIGALLARSADQGLLVVARSDSGSFGRALLGPTSLGVAQRSRIPVVIVPDAWTQARHVRQPVVVGADRGEMHFAAIAFAFREARRRGVGLVVVLDSAPTAELIEPLRTEFDDVPVEVVVSDRALATSLIDAARSAQLLVLGRESTDGPSGLTFGDTARAVLHGAAVPLAVVP